MRDDDDDPSYEPGVAGNEHGTACAGVAAARGDNGIGIAGVCPECTLRCVRLLGGEDEPTPISADIAAFSFAFEVGAAVVSNSWGFAEPFAVPSMLRQVIEDLYDHGRDGRGTHVMFAAGNDNRELEDSEIEATREVVAVGALNLFDEIAPYGNFGSLDPVAPTGSLTTDIAGADGAGPGDYTSLFGGTSSPCPVVAGVAALLFSAAPELTAREVHDILIETARTAPYAVPDERGHDPAHGYGIVGPFRALSRVVDAGPPGAGPADAGAREALSRWGEEERPSALRVDASGRTGDPEALAELERLSAGDGGGLGAGGAAALLRPAPRRRRPPLRRGRLRRR